MSVDRQIDQTCRHSVSEELLNIQTDRRTAVPLRPIASAGSVLVRLNGEVSVPFSGLQVPGRVLGTREGPFTLTTGNNVLSLQVEDDPIQTVTFPQAVRLTAPLLARQLSDAFVGVTFFVERNRVGVRSSMSGREAIFRFHTASTMAPLLGIPTNRIFRGKTTFPGWSLVTDPTTLSDRPRRLLFFDEPLQAASNFVEISYATVREECRRCGGVGVENDWMYGPNGEVVFVRDETLLIQELTKITYTARGSNPFHPWYGTTILERIGSKNASSGVVQNTITSDIYTTFARWQSIKRQQEEIGQIVTDREYPFRLMRVQLEQSQQDPTVIFVNIEVQSRSFAPFVITRGLQLADHFALTG